MPRPRTSLDEFFHLGRRLRSLNPRDFTELLDRLRVLTADAARHHEVDRLHNAHAENVMRRDRERRAKIAARARRLALSPIEPPTWAKVSEREARRQLDAAKRAAAKPH